MMHVQDCAEGSLKKNSNTSDNKLPFNGSQLAKMKKYIPYMSLPWNL